MQSPCSRAACIPVAKTLGASDRNLTGISLSKNGDSIIDFMDPNVVRRGEVLAQGRHNSA